jgi:hypothetical protein
VLPPFLWRYWFRSRNWRPCPSQLLLRLHLSTSALWSLVSRDSHILGNASLYESMRIRSMRWKGDGEAPSLFREG